MPIINKLEFQKAINDYVEGIPYSFVVRHQEISLFMLRRLRSYTPTFTTHMLNNWQFSVDAGPQVENGEHIGNFGGSPTKPESTTSIRKSMAQMEAELADMYQVSWRGKGQQTLTVYIYNKASRTYDYGGKSGKYPKYYYAGAIIDGTDQNPPNNFIPNVIAETRQFAAAQKLAAVKHTKQPTFSTFKVTR